MSALTTKSQNNALSMVLKSSPEIQLKKGKHHDVLTWKYSPKNNISLQTAREFISRGGKKKRKKEKKIFGFC